LDGNQAYPVEKLRRILRATTFRGFPVVAFKHVTSDVIDMPSSRPHSPRENTFLGYISRTELAYALDRVTKVPSSTAGSHDLPSQTPCYFNYHVDIISGRGIDLRPWMNQTPITLNVNTSLQLAVHMFQNLGLRYLLFVERGAFRGMLTKKDVWWILSAAEDGAKREKFVAGAGVLRDDAEEDNGPDEARSLLQQENGGLEQHIASS